MFSTPNLAKRGTVYYFRIAVPKALVLRFGRAELTASLRTSHLLEAKVRCRAISSVVEALFERIPRMPTVSIPEINEKVRGYFQECLNKGEEYVQEFPDDPTINISDEAAYLRRKVEQMRTDLSYACFPQDVRDLAREMVHAQSVEHGYIETDAFRYACRVIMRAKIESDRVLAAKFSGDYVSVAPKDILFDGMVTTGLPPIPGEKAEPVHAMLSFAEVVDLYLAQKTPSWAAKTIQAVTYALKIASELYGPNKPMSLYGTSDKKLLRDTLAKLPPQQTKAAKFANLTALAAAAAKEHLKNLCLSA